MGSWVALCSSVFKRPYSSAARPRPVIFHFFTTSWQHRMGNNSLYGRVQEQKNFNDQDQQNRLPGTALSSAGTDLSYIAQ